MVANDVDCQEVNTSSFQLGGKKMGGLGAQKVKKDFAEIEREAELADQGSCNQFLRDPFPLSN